MEKEIFEQSSTLKQSLLINEKTLSIIKSELKERKIRTVIFSARGSSDNTGVYFKYMCEVYCNIPVSLAAPSVFTLYKSDLDFTDTLVIGVSQSGEAKDVLAVIEAANKQHAYTITITNYPNSPLAKAGCQHMVLGVGEEKSVAATKTFTAQLYLLGLLAATMSDNESLYEGFKNIPLSLSLVLEKADEIKRIAKLLSKKLDCFVLGRGFQYAIAKEIALKLQETTYMKALSFAISDFYHGPFALADANSNFIIIAPKDETWENSQQIIEDLKKLNSHILVITDDVHFTDDYCQYLTIPIQSVYGFPFLSIVAGQLLALHISLEKGLNPDVPRSLNKVTITV